MSSRNKWKLAVVTLQVSGVVLFYVFGEMALPDSEMFSTVDDALITLSGDGWELAGVTSDHRVTSFYFKMPVE